ncbi:MAG: YihY/virulence factor BrkB family protein [Pseudonocardia sp.]|nr:YihY/virulence factor BrkB family protein [Pseudonocardia sp.]
MGQIERGANRIYGIDHDRPALATYDRTVAVPLGMLLLLLAITTLLRHAPRRRQPGWSWLVLGAVLALVLGLVFTGLLVGYVAVSGSFGAVYGPLTGVIALLLWAQFTAVALFSGPAVAAQAEAGRYRRERREDDDGFRRA